MPPLEIPSSPTAAPPRGVIPPRRSHLPIVAPPPRSKLVIMASSPDATARHRDASTTSSSSGTSSSSSGGSSPSSVTTVTTIESHSSSTQVPPASRDLIGEYLAAKSRSQGPPAILIPQVAPPARDAGEDLELAYRHPILLMNDEDEQNVFCSVVSSVGNERNREVEVRYVDDNSIELLDAREDFGEGEKESLIVPKPVKKMAFHSPKASPVKNGVDEEAKCRLVGKVNPNILKTWEQLSGGDKPEPTRRKNSKNSLITVTSSENSSADSKQSCLIFYRNQYNNMAAPEEEEFHVNRIQHASVSTSSSTMMEDKTAPRTSGAMVTSTTTTETTSSEGCYDFYDSIDDSSTRIDGGGGGTGGLPEDEDDDDDEEYGMAAGEGLADFTSLDRKKMMWSIDVEQ